MQTNLFLQKQFLWIPAAFAGLALLMLFWPRGTASKTIDSLQSFAACLRDKQVTMYGSDLCENCRVQKKMFGKFFDSINYVNCDFKQQECEGKGLRYYPVWMMGQHALTGLQSLPQLASFSGCSLPLLTPENRSIS